MELELVNQIPEQLRDIASNIEGPLAQFALQLLQYLFAISIIWGFLDSLLARRQLDGALEIFVRQIIQASFFAGLINNWSSITDWAISLFSDAATRASGMGSSFSPSSIIATGVVTGGQLLELGSVWDAEGWLLMLMGGLIIAALIWIAGLTVLALAEIYFVTAGSVAFMGLSGTTWTLDTAISQLRFVGGAAAKLFSLIFLVGVFQQMALDWSETFSKETATMEQAIVAIALTAIMATAIYSLPNIAQSLISGQVGGWNTGANRAMAMAGGSIGALGKAIGAGVGGTLLASAAPKAAKMEGAGAAGGASGAMSLTKRTASIAAAEVASSAQARISGTGAHRGSMLWNAATHRQAKNASGEKQAQQLQHEKQGAQQQKRDDAAKKGRQQSAAHGRAIQQEKTAEVMKARTVSKRANTGGAVVKRG